MSLLDAKMNRKKSYPSVKVLQLVTQLLDRERRPKVLEVDGCHSLERSAKMWLPIWMVRIRRGYRQSGRDRNIYRSRS